MERIIKFEILKAVYEECIIYEYEPVHIHKILKRNITTRAYFYIILKELIKEELLGKSGKFIFLEKKGMKKLKAYFVLMS